MTPSRRLLAAGGAIALAAGALAVGRRRTDRSIARARQRVVDGARPLPADAVDPSTLEPLPEPIRRYLDRVLEPGQPHVTGVDLRQRGEFRLGGADGDWHPFSARQTYGVNPPGYVWDATVDLAPLVAARVADAYVDGEGFLRATLLGAIPVARAGPDPRMNEAELQRYLAETPWFPTALLPAAGVAWSAIDEHSARATLTDGDVCASAVFHVDEAGHVRRVTADRYRQDADRVAPWVGRFDSYEPRGGMVIPTAAEVAWVTPGGAVPYWRGRVTEIAHRVT